MTRDGRAIIIGMWECNSITGVTATVQSKVLFGNGHFIVHSSFMPAIYL